ncbi:MAG TPA: SLC13 family permease [Anaerolineales bacterium]
MTYEISALLFILGIAVVLFSFEWVSVDIVAIGILLSLVLLGLVPTEDAFAGFGNETVVMILCLFILTAALVRTGVIDIIGRALLSRINNNPSQITIIVMGAAAVMSTFMSNTASAAFFAPVVMGLSRRLRISASRLLMPVAFAAILASSMTLVSTSTNLVVNGLMLQYGMKAMGMFELTPVGIPILLVGLVYMASIGKRMIPDRSHPEELTQEFNLRPYLTEIVILPNSSLAGKTLVESGLGREYDFTVLRITRDDDVHLVPHADVLLEQGDVLLVEGHRDQLFKIKDWVGIGVAEEVALSDPDLQTKDYQLAEVILLPRSPLIGRRLTGVDLREQYGVQVLAINRHESTLRSKIGQIPLQMGDVLLVQGPRFNLSTLEKSNTFRVLGTFENMQPNHSRAWLAMAIFVGALLLAIFDLVSLPVAVLLGTLVAFITRCITPEEAYREVEWKAVILIGSMLSLGGAMEFTGTSKFLALQIVRLVGETNPVWLLTGFFMLTVIMTQPMSNQAAAAVVLPVALQTAIQLGLNPRTFAMMIAVAASTSYITPLEPACLIVYGLGRYRFTDFLKVGSLLTVFIYIVAILLVPRVWSLY